jgi:hypothetical protein
MRPADYVRPIGCAPVSIHRTSGAAPEHIMITNSFTSAQRFLLFTLVVCAKFDVTLVNIFSEPARRQIPH